MRIEAFLSQSPMFAVHRAARSFEQIAASALAEDGLSFLEGLLLASLFFEAPRKPRPSELAECFATTRGNISHTISSLEAAGLVERRIDPDDARVCQLVLKPAGKRAALRVIAALDKLQNRFEKQLGKAMLREWINKLDQLVAAHPAK